MSGINIKDVKISFNGTKLKKFGSDFFTIDELNTGSEIDRIEHAIKYGMQKIMLRNFRAFQSFVTKEKECMYSEYFFKYASKLPESQRFGKSSIVLAQALNLLKYMDNADRFQPLKFNLQPVKINEA